MYVLYVKADNLTLVGPGTNVVPTVNERLGQSEQS